jgi:hypothetical protein
MKNDAFSGLTPPVQAGEETKMSQLSLQHRFDDIPKSQPDTYECSLQDLNLHNCPMINVIDGTGCHRILHMFTLHIYDLVENHEDSIARELHDLSSPASLQTSLSHCCREAAHPSSDTHGRHVMQLMSWVSVPGDFFSLLPCITTSPGRWWHWLCTCAYRHKGEQGKGDRERERGRGRDRGSGRRRGR